MGKPVVGAVVVLPFPQSDLRVGKRRPALVLADLKGDDLVLCQIITVAQADDFEQGRLSTDSLIRPNRPFTVEQTVILYQAAKVKSAKRTQARAKARARFR